MANDTIQYGFLLPIVKIRILCIIWNMEITATEFAKNFGLYREVAQREPVAVMNHNRITGYFVSAKEFEGYIKHKSKAMAVEELSEDTIRLIAAAKMDKRHNHLNALLDD